MDWSKVRSIVLDLHVMLLSAAAFSGDALKLCPPPLGFEVPQRRSSSGPAYPDVAKIVSTERFPASPSSTQRQVDALRLMPPLGTLFDREHDRPSQLDALPSDTLRLLHWCARHDPIQLRPMEGPHSTTQPELHINSAPSVRFQRLQREAYPATVLSKDVRAY